MDYRTFAEKYGSILNRAISDQKFIDWIIETLQNEGFGDSKTTIVVDGYSISSTKIAEDASTVTYQVDYIDVNDVQVGYTITEGTVHEWGKVLNPADLTLEITITRRTYALDSVDFQDFSEADKDRITIDAAGVNDTVGTSDYPWVLSGITNSIALSNGDTQVGTVTTEDDRNTTILHPITITRPDRYIWGILRGTDTSANIAAALASVTGNIVPADDDATFLELTTGLGAVPSTLDIDTVGENRTFFVASIPTVGFQLESGMDFPIDAVSESINLNSISSGDVNLARSYNMYVLDLNTNFTLNRV